MTGQRQSSKTLSGRILVVDDDPLARWSLRQRLDKEGHDLLEAEEGRLARQHFERGVDLVLLDHCLPGVEGIELLRQFVAADANVPIIMLTAFSSVEHAVEAMRVGAFHYAAKPFDLDEITLLVQRALRTARLERRLHALQSTEDSRFGGLVGESPVMKDTKALLAKVAQSPSSTVLITGESGTGKDLAARLVHSLSERKEGPFLNVTCSALTASLLESELFGHERGAFTDAKERRKGLFELAHTGTVFLDEIGEMSLEMQAKLLRFLEEKVFRRVGGSIDLQADVRVIAATNIDIRRAVNEGRFRQDLYYRIAVLTVEMPPLRAREGDLPLLLDHFVDRFKREFHKPVEGVSPATLKALLLHSWPGNVRELRNAIERAVLLADQPTLSKSDFTMIEDTPPTATLESFRLPSKGIDLASLEKSLVRQALDRAKGNRTLAATLLGMNRDQIRYRIDKFGLSEHLPPKVGE